MAASSHSAVLKREIEAKLAARIPGALSPQAQQAPRLLPCGVTAVDRLLDGGLPLGGISELTGMASSGRTSLAFALLAEATRDSACAYVDVDDSVDPHSAAAAGVSLRNLLWVRVAAGAGDIGRVNRPLAEQGAGLAATGAGLAGTRVEGAVVAQDPAKPASVRAGFAGHPRQETKQFDHALSRLMVEKAEARAHKMQGTPGAPNQPLGLAAASEEQIRYDQYNARKADERDPIHQANLRSAERARERTEAPLPFRAAAAVRPWKQQDVSQGKSQGKPWGRLDKAIRATDQLLQSGGFRVVVLDLANVPAEQALRIPAATWFRFRRAAQESDAILLLLTQSACARSSALCVLDCAAEGTEASAGLWSGFSRTAVVSRQRLGGPLGKKAPGRATAWAATPSWMRAAGR
ncbi:recombinase A [Acidipila sp. EB88]|uniref:recombinase A n=1 Tax=Acidipila sp. EB88 TaxID=2305226 RepID=UPI000F5EC28F|nr:recombinase A [Acidipila sp. EB88]RRA48314.1 recombinase A [Acidipila sp. EB88]